MERNAVQKLVSYATAMTLLGSPLTGYALGLGRLVVNSPIDTPLDAEIELTSLGTADLGTIQVELASRQEFDNATIERSQILQQLKFEIDRSSGSSPVIHVTSDQAVSEPFLQFLITVQWPGGKLIREYTALLDPPLYAGAQNQSAIQAPTTDTTFEQPPAVEGVQIVDAPTTTIQPTDFESGTRLDGTPETIVVESTEAAPVTGVQSGIVTGSLDDLSYPGGSVTTQAGDTLTQIVSTVNLPQGVNPYQMMAAILQANPQAFINNNMNRLKRGVELRIPESTAQFVTRAEARDIFSAQLAQFESFKQGVATSVPTQSTDRVTQVDETPTQTVPEGDSRESTVSEDAAETATRTTDTAAAAVDTPKTAEPVEPTIDRRDQVITTDGQLKISKAETPEGATEQDKLLSQLAQAEEQVSALDAENLELRERLALLEGKVEQTTRLAQIEQSRLAELESQAKIAEQARKDAAAAEEQTRIQEQAQAERKKQEEAQRLAAELAQQEIDKQTGSVTPPVPGQTTETAAAKIVDTTSAATEESKSFLDTAKSKIHNLLGSGDDSAQAEDSTAGAAGGGGILDRVGGFFGSLVNTIKGFIAGSWAMMGAFGLIVMGLIGLIIWRRRRSIAEFEESILSGSALDIQTDTAETATASTAATDTSFLSEFGVPGMGGMQTDEVDPIAEAEVYMAYGRDEQAEEVLKEAINRDSRPELKLKLLEIYRSRNDVKEFETLAEELYPAHGNEPDDVWKKVVEMGQQVSPDNPLFKGGVVAASAAAVGAAIGGGVGSFAAAQTTDSDLDAGAADGIPTANLAAAAGGIADRGLSSAGDVFPQPSVDAGADAELDQLTQQAELTNPSLEAFQLDGIEGTTSEPSIDPGIPYDPVATDAVSGDISYAEDVISLDPTASSEEAGSSDSLKFRGPDDLSLTDEDEAFALDSVDEESDQGLSLGAGIAAAGTAAAGLGAVVGGSVSDIKDKAASTLSDAKEESLDLFKAGVDSDLPDELSLDDIADDSADTVELFDNVGGGSQNAPAGHDGLHFDGADESTDLEIDRDVENLISVSPESSIDSDDIVRFDSDALDINDAQSTTAGIGVPGSADGSSDNATKLDLAKAYRDMGDDAGARGFLEEVIRNGDDEQREEAADLMSQIESV